MSVILSSYNYVRKFNATHKSSKLCSAPHITPKSIYVSDKEIKEILKFNKMSLLTKNVTILWKKCLLSSMNSNLASELTSLRMSNSPSLSSLIVLTCNCNSLSTKINENRIFISYHRLIDVIFLQETRNPNWIINIHWYRLHYTPRVGDICFGGTAIYIKSHKPQYTTQNATFLDIDCISIIFQLPNNNINLTSIYVKPSDHSPANCLKQFHRTKLTGCWWF